MAQSSAFLLAKSAGGVDESKVYFLGRVNKVSFMNPVIPGDQLITTIKVEKLFGSSAMVSAVSKVGDKTVAKGELMFGIG